MAERTNPFQKDEKEMNFEQRIQEASSKVKEDVQSLVEGFDFQSMARKVEDFGRENPLGLAVSALTLGVAFGFMMRSSKKNPMH